MAAGREAGSHPRATRRGRAASGCEAASGHPPLFPPPLPSSQAGGLTGAGGRRGDSEGQRPPAPGWSQGQHPGLCSSPSKLSLGGKTQLEQSDPGRIKCPGSGEGGAPAQPRSTLVHPLAEGRAGTTSSHEKPRLWPPAPRRVPGAPSHLADGLLRVQGLLLESRSTRCHPRGAWGRAQDAGSSCASSDRREMTRPLISPETKQHSCGLQKSHPRLFFYVNLN